MISISIYDHNSYYNLTWWRFIVGFTNNKVVKWLDLMDLSTDTIIHIAIRLAVFPVALLLGIIVIVFLKRDKDNGEGSENKRGGRVPSLPRVKTVDELVKELRKTMRGLAKPNPESWLSIQSELTNVTISFDQKLVDSLVFTGVPRNRSEELHGLIFERLNDGYYPLEEMAEMAKLHGGEGNVRNLRSLTNTGHKIGELTQDLWFDYIAGKPVIDNLLALLSKPDIEENCAGLWCCANLAYLPGAKEALAQDALGIIMQFVEDMGPLDDGESIYCCYKALELLVLCTSANEWGPIPSTLDILKDSIRDNIASHPEWTSKGERFLRDAALVQPDSPILLQERICDALDKALETDPEIIDTLLKSEGLRINVNKDTPGRQTDYLSMDPIEFEHEVARLFNSQGYRMEVTTASRDGGIDILGFAPGIGEQRVAVQCKRYQGTVGRPEVQQFWGIISGSEYASGFFVTTGRFTNDAKQFTEDKPRLVLVDGEELAKWDR